MKNQEVLRYYVTDYWFNYKFILEKKVTSNDYIFLDKYRFDIFMNDCRCVFVKFVDEKYYYVYYDKIPSNYYNEKLFESYYTKMIKYMEKIILIYIMIITK